MGRPLDPSWGSSSVHQTSQQISGPQTGGGAGLGEGLGPLRPPSPLPARGGPLKDDGHVVW